MKTLTLELNLPKESSGYVVKFILKHDGQIIHTGGVILPPALISKDKPPPKSTLVVAYEGEQLLNQEFESPKINPKNSTTL